MGNDSIAAKIKSAMNAPDPQSLPAVTICGGASPEGTLEINMRLSRQRAAAIARYFNIPDSTVTATFTGRDWNGLQTLIAEDPNVPFKDEVNTVIAGII